MQFKDYFLEIKEGVEKELSRFLGIKIKESRKYSSLIKFSFESIREYVLRGKSKRVRAGLVYLGYDLFSDARKKKEDILKVAGAIELIHAYFLIHDDIIDKDVLRRGGPTMHKIAEAYHKEFLRGSPEHFGISLAIIIGDICNSLAKELVLETNFPIALKLEIIKLLEQMILQTCYGEMIDVWLAVKRDADEKDILEAYELKTARYTFQFPLEIGVIMSGVERKNLKTIEDYALKVGVIFQLRDDIIGIFGDKEKIGKDVCSDIREGKMTFLLKKTLENASKREKVFIQKKLGSKINQKDIREIREIIKKSGSLNYCETLIDNLNYKAKKCLKKFVGARKEKVKLLEEISDYLSKREA